MGENPERGGTRAQQTGAMGCCCSHPLSCVVFMPPGRCALNPHGYGDNAQLLYEGLQNYDGFKFLMLETYGLRVPSVHIRCMAKAQFTIIYSHGNAEDLGGNFEQLHNLADLLSCNVFAYEYPGYGIAEGEPSEGGCYAAAEAAYKHVTNELGVDAGDVVLYGRSLGSGPTV